MKTYDTSGRKRPTVKDVARLAGVSAGTISNAISGKRKVDADTRLRIDAAIQELGYVPNLAARSTRTGRTHTIAVFSSMPTAVAAGASKLGFLMEIAASAAVTALERNTALVLIPPIEDPSEILGTIPLDGAILVEPEADDPFLQRLQERRIPTVIIGDSPENGLPCIRLDYEKMAAVLFDHLVASGAHQFPLVIGCSPRSTNSEFNRVYRAKCAAIGMEPRVISVPEGNAEEAATIAICAEIDSGRKMDGVLVTIDAMASGVMTALASRGRRVPDDVRVATRYDGIRSRSATPPITAINMRLEDVSRRATGALLDLIEGKTRASQIGAPDFELVTRRSTMSNDPAA